MPDPSRGRFLRAFVYAWRGIALSAGERNFRIHLAAAALVVLAAGVLGVTPGEWALLVLCIFWVLGMEAVNTALESLADRVSGEADPLIARAKDLAAGAVLLSAIGAAVVGLIIFLPHL